MLASEHSDIPPAPLLVPRPREMELRDWFACRADVSLNFDPIEMYEVGARSAERAGLQHANLRIAPSERGFRRRREPQLDLTIELVPDLPGGDEAYELSIDPGADTNAPPRIRIRHARRGLWPARHTLWQLCSQWRETGRARALTIRDWPAFAKRGVMLDVSRSRIPTMLEFTRLVGDLAALKFNHLQLYTEHAFAYKGSWGGGGHDRVWQPHDPITREQLLEIQELCDINGIELAANQNCFGHLSEWLRHPAYAHLSEMGPDEAWRFMHWERRGPFSLCPTNPASIEFVAGMLGELLPLLKSPLVNIGCDETYDVGFGRSAAFVAQRGEELARSRGVSVEQGRELARAALYVNHLAQVCSVAYAHGKTPMFWADMAIKHPEMLKRLAAQGSGTPIGLVWGYEPETDFAAGLRALEHAGLPGGWVCPGTSTWRSFAGRTTESRANILRAAREGIAQSHGRPAAGGFLVCDWGDVGHMQQWQATLARLADAAEAAWTGGGPVRVNGEALAHAHADERAVSLHVFHDRSLSAATWLNELGDVDLDLRQHAHANYSPDPSSRGIKNASALFTDLFPPVPLTADQQVRGERAVEASIEDWERVRERLLALEQRRREMSRSLELGAREAFGSPEITLTLNLMLFAADHAIAQRLPRSAPDRAARFAELVQRARVLLKGHERLWKKSCRVGQTGGGLDASSKHLRGVIEALVSQACK